MSLFARRLFCPACLVELDPTRIEVRNSSNERTGEYRSLRQERNRDQVLGDLQKGIRLTCPKGHVLPDRYGEVPHETVAMVGPSMSMKTHFLAVTAHRAIEEDLYASTFRDVALEFSAPPTTHEVLTGEYAGLLDGGRALGRTLPLEDAESKVRHPICLTIDGHIARTVVRNHWTKHLLLFDAPGERVAGKPEQQAEVSPYLTDATVVIFFVDLLQIKEVRSSIDLDVPSVYLGDYSSKPLVWTSRLIATSGRRTSTGEADVPAIVVLSKADVLRHATGELREIVAPWIDRLEELTDEENAQLAEQLIERYALAVLKKAMGGFRSVTFHVASALGRQPAADGGVDAIEPFGCDAVFRAILQRTRMGEA